MLWSRRAPPHFACGRQHPLPINLRRVTIHAGLLIFIFVAVEALAMRAHAEQSGNAPCAGRLRMFVLLVDDLFARKVRVHEAYYELMRNWLPDKGEMPCRVEEALSILETSKFFVKSRPSSIVVQSSAEVVVLRNEDLHVTFALDKATGVFGYRAAAGNKIFP
jgi:hypothetical protein